MHFPSITTKRLNLRPWKQEDLALFAAMNQDPRVMEYFPSLLTEEETEKFLNRIKEHFNRYGYGLWAVSLRESEIFIGFIGLVNIDPSFPSSPAVEVGWRLNADHWGKGYATEGAKACLEFGFDTLKLSEIVSFTAEQNMRSRRVMEKIGMHHETKDDFDHPKLPEGHALKRHVLYRIKAHELQPKKKYVFKPYSETFPQLFEKEKKRILSVIGSNCLIEHVGSTAVPGLGGKGIIDIAIAVDKKSLDLVKNLLQTLGYEFRPSFSTEDRLYFIAYLPDNDEKFRRYHIHLTYPENSEWKHFLGFRDYLTAHPEEAKRYAEIKEQAAIDAKDDGEKYRKMKEAIITKIIGSL